MATVVYSEKQLGAMKYMELRKIAKELKITIAGKKPADLIRDIKKKQSAAKGKGTAADPVKKKPGRPKKVVEDEEEDEDVEEDEEDTDAEEDEEEDAPAPKKKGKAAKEPEPEDDEEEVEEEEEAGDVEARLAAVEETVENLKKAVSAVAKKVKVEVSKYLDASEEEEEPEDDGEEDDEDSEDEEEAEDAGPKPDFAKKGAKVEANFDGVWSKGTITKIKADESTVVLDMDDEESTADVPWNLIRLPKVGKGKKAAPVEEDDDEEAEEEEESDSEEVEFDEKKVNALVKKKDRDGLVEIADQINEVRKGSVTYTDSTSADRLGEKIITFLQENAEEVGDDEDDEEEEEEKPAKKAKKK